MIEADRTYRTAWLALTLTLALAACVVWTAEAAATPPPPGLEPAGRVIMVRSPTGRQYLTVGLELGLWTGLGTLTPTREDGTPGEPVDLTTTAFSAGPLTVGIAHVVARGFMVEARLGAGALLFTDDRLVSTRLEVEGGEPHVGWLAGAEVLGRYFHEGGFTVGAGLRLDGIGLPEASTRTLRGNVRAGYIGWDERFDSYWTVEGVVGAMIINGLIPDFQTEGEAPIASSWWTGGVYVGLGF